MLSFICIMGVGVVIGYGLGGKERIDKIGVVIEMVVCVLVFILGVCMGRKKVMIGKVSYLWEEGGMMWMVSVLGRCVGGVVVCEFLFKKGGKGEG